jgi:hypothetical protein
MERRPADPCGSRQVRAPNAGQWTVHEQCAIGLAHRKAVGEHALRNAAFGKPDYVQRSERIGDESEANAAFIGEFGLALD